MFFVGILGRSKTKKQDPDPLVRGMDPRIQIQIHPNMSWIRNTGFNNSIPVPLYYFLQAHVFLVMDQAYYRVL